MIFLIVSVALVCAAPAAQAESRPYQRSIERYAVPDVTLIDQNGKKVRFNKVLESDRPVVVDFIFGTCTTICPVLSAGYANIQQKIGPDTRKIKLVSISIDPENDSPKVMLEYLKRYRAKPGWDFFTGSRADIDKCDLPVLVCPENDAVVDGSRFCRRRIKMEHQPC